MNMKRMMVVAFMAAILGGMAAHAAVKVTDVISKQRYPWNGLVDITCKVTGLEGESDCLKFAVTAVMPDTGNARSVSHFWVMQGGTNSTDR